MERIPEYCKIGFVTGVGTVVNCLLYSSLAVNPLPASLIAFSKFYLLAFPAFGLTASAKKMYDYHTTPRTEQRIEQHAD